MLRIAWIVRWPSVVLSAASLGGCVSPPPWVPYCDETLEKIEYEETSALGISAADFLGLSLAEINDFEMLSAQSDVTWADETQTTLLWGFAVDETRPVYWVDRFPAEPPKNNGGTALIALNCTDTIAVEGDLLLQTDDGRLGEETFRGVLLQIQSNATQTGFIGDLSLDLDTTDFSGTINWDGLSSGQVYDTRSVSLSSYLDEAGAYTGALHLNLVREEADTTTVTAVDVGAWSPKSQD